MQNIFQAFILAAGRGERMRPLTDTIPKPLAKIKGRAIIDYALQKVCALPQIKKVVVNCYHLAEILQEHLQNLQNPKIIISRESEKLETGGGLVNALPLFDEQQPILIINGDILWHDQNNTLLQKMLANFDDKTMDILVALKPKEQFFGYHGNGDFNLNHKTGELSTASNASHVYIGIQIFHPRILKTKPAEKCFSLGYFFKPEQIKNNTKIRGLEIEEKVFHIGDMKTLEKINDL